MTTTAENYKIMIHYFSLPKILNLPASTTFQQAGVFLYSPIYVQTFMNKTLSKHWIGTKHLIAWSPWSPNLSFFDCFFRSLIKDFIPSLQKTFLHLIAEIIMQAIEGISTQKLEAVWKNINILFSKVRGYSMNTWNRITYEENFWSTSIVLHVETPNDKDNYSPLDFEAVKEFICNIYIMNIVPGKFHIANVKKKN